MHTSALTPTSSDNTHMVYEGSITDPVCLERDPATGLYSLRIVIQPKGTDKRRIISHIAVDAGETATVAAQALADRLNKAAKQGRDAIQIQARAQHAILVLRCAAIVSHEEPERQETTPPKAVKVADLFAAA